MAGALIEITITPEMLDRARARAESQGILRRNLNGKNAVLVGMLGEEIVASSIPGLVQSQGSDIHNFDYKLNNQKLEIKSRNTRTVPRPYYDCSLYAYTMKQETDFYVFTRIHEDLGCGWILGFISKADFLKKAEFRPAGYQSKGQYDKNGNPVIYKEDSYDISIADLD